MIEQYIPIAFGFSGKLFELLESFGRDYLVKVKLKNLSVPE